MEGCRACGGRLRPFGGRLGYSYEECTRCKSFQLVPEPSRTELAEAYKKIYAQAGHSPEFAEPTEWEHAARPFHDAVVAAARSWGAQPPFLDYGAGWGFLAARLSEGGRACVAIEPSAEMAAHAASLGVRVIGADLDAAEAAGTKFGTIVLCNVFEHLIRHSDWLRRASDLLLPGGLLISMHPTAAFFRLAAGLARACPWARRGGSLPEIFGGFAPPWHTALFSVQGTETLASRAGLELLDVRRGPQRRGAGARGAAQRLLDAVNRVGWRLADRRWVLTPAHLFVFSKARGLVP